MLAAVLLPSFNRGEKVKGQDSRPIAILWLGWRGHGALGSPVYKNTQGLIYFYTRVTFGIKKSASDKFRTLFTVSPNNEDKFPDFRKIQKDAIRFVDTKEQRQRPSSIAVTTSLWKIEPWDSIGGSA